VWKPGRSCSLTRSKVERIERTPNASLLTPRITFIKRLWRRLHMVESPFLPLSISLRTIEKPRGTHRVSGMYVSCISTLRPNPMARVMDVVDLKMVGVGALVSNKNWMTEVALGRQITVLVS